MICNRWTIGSVPTSCRGNWLDSSILDRLLQFPDRSARAMAAVAPRKGKGSSTASGGVTKTKRRRKTKVLPPLLSPGTNVEVLRNGKWVGGGTVTIRNDRTYMVRLPDGMTVLMTRGRVRPTDGYGTLYL